MLFHSSKTSVEKYMTEFKHISLFAGMGGFVVGLEDVGVGTTLTNDFEPSCEKTLKKLCPETLNIGGDLLGNKVREAVDSLGHVDIVTGGFPCQPFSVAGEQEGFQDLERGSKFFDMMELIDLLDAPPKVLFLENVANLKTYNDGQWLAQIITKLRKSGYWVNDRHCFILNSADVSSTVQQRERLYIVAYHSAYFRRNHFDTDFSRIKSKKIDLWSVVDRSVKAEERIYLDPSNKHFLMIEKCAREEGSNRLFQIRRGSVRAVKPGVCPTLTANMGGGGHNVPFVIDDFGIRRLSVHECLALQGFDPAIFHFPDGLSDSAKLKMIGNSVNPNVISVIGERIVEDIKQYAKGLAISA